MDASDHLSAEDRARDVLRPDCDVGARVRAKCAPPLVEDLEQAIAAAIRDAERAIHGRLRAILPRQT